MPTTSPHLPRTTLHTLSMLAIVPALACNVLSCSNQKRVNQDEYRSESPTSAPQGDAVSDRKEQRPEEANSVGPAGPQVLLGGQAKGVQLSALPRDLTMGKGLLVAIDTPYQVFDDRGSYVHVAAWRMDGTPAQDADVFVGDTHMGTTNEHGSFVFLYPPRPTQHTHHVPNDVPSRGVLTVVDGETRTLRGSVSFQPNLRTASFASDHLFAYTDRGVYKPGDRVKMRLIGWHLEGDYAPLIEADIKILLRDPHGKAVGGALRTTDEYGVASLEIPIPLTAPQGSYTLEVAHALARQTASLQVRDFQPPAVLIEHDLPRFLRAGDARLDTSVTLSNTQGDAFGQGTLTLNVAGVGGEQLFTTSHRIEGNGPHPLSISSRELERIKSSTQVGTSLQVTLELQDRETHTTDRIVRDMRYVLDPYVAVLELDKEHYTTGDAVEVMARIKDLDGVPLRQKPATIRLGKERFEATTDSSGTAHFHLTMPATSSTITLHIEGVSTPLTTTSLEWSEPRAMVSHIDDPIIEERQKAHVTVKFPADVVPAERFVHLDVVDTSGAIVNAVLLPISETADGHHIASGAFDSPSWGSMLLTFFALGQYERDRDKNRTPSPATLGLLTEGQNLVVHPDRELTILLDGVPDHIAPGSKLHIDAQVLDKQGYPADASLGISVSDRRILSMKDPLEITPMDHFYDPTLRTMSTTGAKILSWPVVSRNWGSRTHDVALPPFPYLEGGPIEHITAARGGGDAGGAAQGQLGDLDAPSEEVVSPPSLHGSKKKEMAAEGATSDLLDRREQHAPDATQITIRTRFPETSTWRPHVRVAGGSLDHFTLELPDTIAEQELLLVASNKKGAVGIARKRIRVTQELFAQAQFPTSLHANETILVPVLVRNSSDVAQRLEVSFLSDDIHARTPARTLELKPGSSSTVSFELTARGLGELPYRLTLSSAEDHTRHDALHGTILAHPTGARNVKSQRGALRPSGKQVATFTTTFSVPESASSAGAWMTLSPPTVTTALAALETLRDEIQTQPLLIASDLASAALIIQYAERERLASSQLDDLHQRVLGALASLQVAQREDGAFSYWRNGQPGPYITAWALEGMLEALQLDMPVPQDAIARAAQYLIDAHDSDGFVHHAALATWEGDDATVRLGLTAEIFAVLTRIPTSMQSDTLRAFLLARSDTFSNYLQRDDLDPLTAAKATQGLMRMEKLAAKDARKILTRLLQTRDDRHWEPSWFHAYGGRVEVTTAMLVAMTMADRDAFATEIRDALDWILSTREAWGAWHNERGTASALRALLLVAPEQGASGTLVVKLDGEEVERITLDAKDPFMSAPQLAHLTLGTALTPGEHRVEVTFDGAPMRIPVQLFTQTVENASTAPRKHTAHGDTIEILSAPSKLDARNARQGAITLAISLHEGHPPTTLHISRSALIEPDLAAWQELVDTTEDILSWRLTPHDIQLELSEELTNTKLTLPYQVARRGSGSWPAISLTPHATNVTPPPTPLIVSAGKLHIQ